jgi:hypothetical protein
MLCPSWFLSGQQALGVFLGAGWHQEKKSGSTGIIFCNFRLCI